MQSILKVLPDPNSFLNKIFGLLESNKINVDNFELDHICFRTESIEQYEYLKNELSSFGELLSENLINNRPISIIKLNEPIVFKNRKIILLELPAPKKGSFYPAGFEHVEFVIDENLDQFVERYPSINFDKKGIEKEVNPDVRVKFSDVSVKFHLHNLEYVIRYLD